MRGILSEWLSFLQRDSAITVCVKTFIIFKQCVHALCGFAILSLNPATNYTLFCLLASVHTKYSRWPESSSAKTVVSVLNSFNPFSFHPAANCRRSEIMLEYVHVYFFQGAQHYETFLSRSSIHRAKFFNKKKLIEKGNRHISFCGREIYSGCCGSTLCVW